MVGTMAGPVGVGVADVTGAVVVETGGREVIVLIWLEETTELEETRELEEETTELEDWTWLDELLGSTLDDETVED